MICRIFTAPRPDVFLSLEDIKEHCQSRVSTVTMKRSERNQEGSNTKHPSMMSCRVLPLDDGNSDQTGRWRESLWSQIQMRMQYGDPLSVEGTDRLIAILYQSCLIRRKLQQYQLREIQTMNNRRLLFPHQNFSKYFVRILPTDYFNRSSQQLLFLENGGLNTGEFN